MKKKNKSQVRATWVDPFDGAYVPPLVIYGQEVLTRKCSVCGARHTGFAQLFPERCPKCHRRIALKRWSDDVISPPHH